MEVPSLQVISVVNFHLKVISLQCNPKVQCRFVPYWIRSSTDPLLPSVLQAVFRSSLFVYIKCCMYSLSIQNTIEYKTGKKPLKSEMLLVRFSVGVTELAVFQTLQCTQPLVRWVPETRNLGLKRLKREAHHTPASFSEVKSELSYSSTVLTRFFLACTRTYFRPNLMFESSNRCYVSSQ